MRLFIKTSGTVQPLNKDSFQSTLAELYRTKIQQFKQRQKRCRTELSKMRYSNLISEYNHKINTL